MNKAENRAELINQVVREAGWVVVSIGTMKQ